MQTDDMPNFSAMLIGIGSLYGKTISELLTDIYWQSLEGFEFADVLSAFQRHIQNPDCGQYFPKPADIIRLIEGSGETKALQAWARVERAISQVGAYRSVVFDDALIHAVIEAMGGWISLCHTNLDELPFRANEFQKRYRGFVNKPPERHPPYLYGIAECWNSKEGYAVQPPVLIGEIEKAKQVMVTGGGLPLAVDHASREVQPIMKCLQNR